MKSVNLKKAVEKYAPVEVTLGKTDHYYAKFGNQIISWHVAWYEKEEQTASLVRVRSSCDRDDMQSDYMAGAFYDTIKSAIEAFTYDLRKEATR